MSANTVAKVMAGLGLVARTRKCGRSLTRQGRRPAAPDFVQCRFTAQGMGIGVFWGVVSGLPLV